jgi:hypothetical protein
MPQDAENEDAIARTNMRLHAAQRALSTAYDLRNVLAERIDTVEAEAGGAAVRPDLLEAFRAAERAVLAAQAEMKDAENALAAMEHSVTDREKDIEAIRTVCRQANPDKPAQAGRDAWARDRYIGICDVLIASHKAGRNLAVQDNGRFMELREDELEEEAVWVEAFDDPSIRWNLYSDDIQAQSDDMIDALANLLVPGRK